jgi:predicted nucleic acid-binding Zn ribbon protein
MTLWRRAPRPLASALHPLRDRWEPDTLLAEVQQMWRSTVGAAIAREAVPVSEHAGVLTVSCSASVWAHELDLMAPVILEKLNQGVRGGTLRRLRCTAAG